MKKLIAVTTLVLFGLSVHAEDVVLTDAPKDFIEQSIADCKTYAVEDEVPADEVENYLLVCVNDELEANDYNKLEMLPQL